MTDYAAMSDAELNALVAERVMGWQEVYDVWMTRDGDAQQMLVRKWNPATDHNDAARMRQRIAELGLCDDFVGWLEALLPVEPKATWPRGTWLVLNSTPRRQCEAALRALDEKQATK